MKRKRLLQEVDLRGEKAKIRPILVENDHPLFEAYEDLKTYFQGNIQLAIPRVSNEKNWSNADQIEYYSPVEGKVEKITPVEYDNKVKPLLEKRLNSFKNLSFDESDPDQFEKKALLNSFKLPSEELSEYVVKVGSYYVLCNWGLENAPKLGELPPPPARSITDKDPNDNVEDEREDETAEEIFNDADDVSSSYDDDFEVGDVPDNDDEHEVDEEFENSFDGTSPDINEDENEAVSWFRENWLKILVGVLIFILLLLLIRECNGGLPDTGSSNNSSSETGTTELSSPQSENLSSGTPQQENNSSGSSNPGTENGSEPGVESERDGNQIPDGRGNENIAPSPPSEQSPPIIKDRSDDLLENEQKYSGGIPTDQWEEIGTVFQMETEEGHWYWIRLPNGDTFLLDFIPKEVQTRSDESDINNFNTI